MENEVLINKREVASYFPKDITRLFGIPEDKISFFGLHEQGVDNDKDGHGKFWKKYLAILGDSELDLSFKNSSSKWIRMEHFEYGDLKTKYNELHSKYPLLVVRLISEYMKFDKPEIYANLIRYADHPEFRELGIATKVFDSVSDKCKLDGIEYLYMNARFKLPSESSWIGQGEVPEEDLERISSLFYNKPVHKVLQWYDSYLRILKE